MQTNDAMGFLKAINLNAKENFAKQANFIGRKNGCVAIIDCSINGGSHLKITEYLKIAVAFLN